MVTITDFFLDYDNILKQIHWQDDLTLKIAIDMILEHMAIKNNEQWFNIEFEYKIDGYSEFVRILASHEDWLDLLAEIEKFAIDN